MNLFSKEEKIQIRHWNLSLRQPFDFEIAWGQGLKQGTGFSGHL